MIKGQMEIQLQANQVGQISYEKTGAKGFAEILGNQSKNQVEVAENFLLILIDRQRAQQTFLDLTREKTLYWRIYCKKKFDFISFNISLPLAEFGPKESSPHVWKLENILDQNNGHDDGNGVMASSRSTNSEAMFAH